MSFATEVLLFIGLVGVGTAAIIGSLYPFFKKSLALKLYIGLVPCLTNLCIVIYLFALWGGIREPKLIFIMLPIAVGGIIVNLIVLSKVMTDKITRSAGVLYEGAEQVLSASNQINASGNILAEGTSEQAASIEETSSSLEEMSSMTRQNADNADQADRLSKEAERVVGNANNTMTELTRSMEEISAASEETFKIIKTIDEIAFQTNLLALNAAVEAARAGEAGAGFAVVAEEVRNLAGRAAEAAKNTTALIEGTVQKIKDGSQLVTTSNDAFAEVAENAAKVGELVGEIAAASKEQAQGIDQVNKAVNEMDKVVQSNAATAEETASATEEMSAQSQMMKLAVEELLEQVGGSAYSAKKETRETAALSTPVHRPAFSAAGTEPKTIRPKTAEISPEQLIPLEEDDFQDF